MATKKIKAVYIRQGYKHIVHRGSFYVPRDIDGCTPAASKASPIEVGWRVIPIEEGGFPEALTVHPPASTELDPEVWYRFDLKPKRKRAVATTAAEDARAAEQEVEHSAEQTTVFLSVDDEGNEVLIDTETGAVTRVA